jgi:ABC-type multidrug transport system ATPase subunit
VDGPFFEDMTVQENILFLESFSKIQIEKKYYEELLEYFEIKTLENQTLRTLSV